MAGFSDSTSSGQSQSFGQGSSQAGSYIPDYAESPILRAIAQYAFDQAPQVYQWGMEQFNKNQGNIDSLLRDALSYASPQRIAVDMGMAEAGVQQAAEQGRQSAVRDLESYGIDPSSGRYAALDQASRVMASAAAAGAGNQQRMADEAAGNAMRNQAISASLQNTQTGYEAAKAMQGLLNTGMALKYPPLGNQSVSQNTTQSESVQESKSHSEQFDPPSGGGSKSGGGQQPHSGGGGGGEGKNPPGFQPLNMKPPPPVTGPGKGMAPPPKKPKEDEDEDEDEEKKEDQQEEEPTEPYGGWPVPYNPEITGTEGVTPEGTDPAGNLYGTEPEGGWTWDNPTVYQGQNADPNIYDEDNNAQDPVPYPTDPDSNIYDNIDPDNPPLNPNISDQQQDETGAISSNYENAPTFQTAGDYWQVPEQPQDFSDWQAPSYDNYDSNAYYSGGDYGNYDYGDGDYGNYDFGDTGDTGDYGNYDSGDTGDGDYGDYGDDGDYGDYDFGDYGDYDFGDYGDYGDYDFGDYGDYDFGDYGDYDFGDYGDSDYSDYDAGDYSDYGDYDSNTYYEGGNYGDSEEGGGTYGDSSDGGDENYLGYAHGGPVKRRPMPPTMMTGYRPRPRRAPPPRPPGARRPGPPIRNVQNGPPTVAPINRSFIEAGGRPQQAPPGMPGPTGQPAPQYMQGGGRAGVQRGNAQPTTGGFVSREMSPSQGQATDDVQARLNTGEFVIPKDTAAWLGKKYFYDLIEKSRKMRGGSPNQQSQQSQPTQPTGYNGSRQ